MLFSFIMEKSFKISKNTVSEENILKWNNVQTDFEKAFGTEIFSSWLKNISLIKEYNDYVILGVQTRFFRDWITSRYADKILSELQKHKLSINRIEFKIEGEKLDGKSIPIKTDINKITDIKDGVLNYNRLNPNLNFNNFVIGRSNKIAFLSAKKISSQLSR